MVCQRFLVFIAHFLALFRRRRRRKSRMWSTIHIFKKVKNNGTGHQLKVNVLLCVRLQFS